MASGPAVEELATSSSWNPGVAGSVVTMGCGFGPIVLASGSLLSPGAGILMGCLLEVCLVGTCLVETAAARPAAYQCMVALQGSKV